MDLPFVEAFNSLFTLYLIFPSIVLLGLYLTFRLRFVQLSKLKMSVSLLFKKQAGEEGSITHYQAVASVLASNFGTGNISGMAVALTTGGPGALMWMWVMAFLGAAIQFANCCLGVKYREKNEKGEYIGGPMYYLQRGLKLKKIAALFCIATILAAFTAGGLVQVNSIALPLTALGISPWVTGGVLAFFVAIVILGGAQRVADMCSTVVPVMAILYLGAAFFILGQHVEALWPAIQEVFRASVGVLPLAGGVAGFTVMKAVTTGFDRAIFATDAGTGTVPLLQSGAKTTDPVIDGVVSLVAPFLVMIVCSSTALVLMVTGAIQVPGLASTNLVTYAFGQGLGEKTGLIIVLIALVLFGYTTTVAWASCLEKAVGFLFGARFIKAALLLYILSVPLGALLHVDSVWLLADISLTAMVLLNLIGVAGLSKEVIYDTRRFFNKPHASPRPLPLPND